MNGTPTTVDQSPDAPRWPRLVVVRVLLPLGILGALALSAAATIAKVDRHGVPVVVQPNAVAMLEVVSIAATLLAIFSITKRLRDRAMIVLVATSAIQLVAGWSAYGWVGLIAPSLLVALVHLAVEAWQEERRELRAGPGAGPIVPGEQGSKLADHPAPDAAPTVPVEPDVEVVDVVEPVRPEPTGPAHGPLTLVEWAADVKRREVGDRVLSNELDVTRHHVRRLLIEARTGLAEVSA